MDSHSKDRKKPLWDLPFKTNVSAKYRHLTREALKSSVLRASTCLSTGLRSTAAAPASGSAAGVGEADAPASAGGVVSFCSMPFSVPSFLPCSSALRRSDRRRLNRLNDSLSDFLKDFLLDMLVSWTAPVKSVENKIDSTYLLVLYFTEVHDFMSSLTWFLIPKPYNCHQYLRVKYSTTNMI